MTSRRRPPVAFVGAGNLARALAPALARARYPVVAVAATTLRSARRLCRELPAARATTRPERAAADGRLLLIAVPDDRIASVARSLAVGVKEGWKTRVVLHHAGALGTEPLAPLREAGAAVGVLHPLQCLGPEIDAAKLLPGSRARLEGDGRALQVARRLARDLRLVPLDLGARLTPADRAAYHAAASVASNDLMALLALAGDLLGSIGMSPDEAIEALVPLARGTVAQIDAAGLEGALTGPVARGDAGTADSQLRRMARRSRSAAETHRLLSLKLLEIAEKSGRLSPARRRDLRRLLRRPRH